MKIYVVIFLLLLKLQYGFTQNDFLRKNDSLQNLLRQPIGDSLKLKVLEDLHFTWKNINLEKSIGYTKQGIELALLSGKPAIATGLKYQLGFAYMQAGDAIRSIEVFQDILTIVEHMPVEYGTALCFIAMNYENMGQYQTALGYQLKGGHICDSMAAIDNKYFDSRSYLGNPHKLGQLNLKLNQIDSAMSYGEIALKRLNELKLTDWDVFFSWYIKTLMGDLYYAKNDLVKALQFYDESESEINKNTHTAYSYIGDLIPVYLGRAKIFFKQGNLRAAIQQARASYQLADTLKTLPGKKESALYLKTLYQASGQFDSAFIYYDLSIAAKDSISNADIARKLDAMEYATERRSQEINSLQQEKKYQKRLLYLTFGIFLTLLLAGLIYQQYRLKQKTNTILALENKEIIQQRGLLQQEVERFEMQALKAQLNPHFIFNCLNNIDAFIYSNDKYKATTYLNKFAKLLRNILDGSDTNTVDIHRDIQSLKLYIELEELRNNHNFVTEYSIDPILETSGLQVPPLIVQPIVENAIIHGLKNRSDQQGILKLSIHPVEDFLEYSIEDNGIGRLAADQLNKIKSDENKSYGVTLVKSRLKLFNHEEMPSIRTEDILKDNKITGTRVIMQLKKVIEQHAIL